MASKLARSGASDSTLPKKNSSASVSSLSNTTRANSSSSLRLPLGSSNSLLGRSPSKESAIRPSSRGNSPRPGSRVGSPRPGSRAASGESSPDSPDSRASEWPDSKDSTRPSGRKKATKPSSATTRQKGGEEIWELRTYQSRRWGHSLKKKGSSNVSAVKNLTGTLKDARVASQISLRRTAIEALMPAGSVGNRGALAAQVKALGDGDETVRRSALKSLQKAAGGKRAERGGAVAETLAETLPDLIKTDNTSVRRAVANALAKLTPNGDKQLAEIALSWIEDEDAKVRASATQALGISGSGSKMLAALVERLNERDWQVNRAAVQALEKYSNVSKKGKDGDPSPREGSSPKGDVSPNDTLQGSDLSNSLGSTATSLGQIDNPSAADQLNDVDAEVRRAAVLALSELAPSDRSAAIRASASQLTSVDFRVRESAGLALVGVAGEGGDALATSLAAAALEGDDWRGRRGAAAALRRLGELDDGNARDAVMAVLVPRLEHPDWSIRRKAAQALGVVAKGQGDIRAIKLLKGLSRDPDQEVRIAVVEALPGAAPPKKCQEAIDMAATFAKDSNPRIRKAALLALQELASVERSRSRVAVHAVNGCIHDKVEDVRLTAERVLQLIAPGRRTAIDNLATQLTDSDEIARQAAANAFAGVGPDRRDRSLKRLVPLLRHKDDGVRQAACKAMQGMTNPEEAMAIEAAANVVAKFRRRFEKPRGHALIEEEDDEDDDGASVSGTVNSSATSVAPTEGRQPRFKAAVTAALLCGDLGKANLLVEEERDLLEQERQFKEDTDTESELSESDTDVDEEDEQHLEED
eukprot:CAMPEP_0169077574 /NCGR_PEP_ID=MMETSP1015-20121227/8952_1 /TAXON_ID=342587 /ORGANISM="Karlodinium micrum, Strain CCMP2283" /LENGTH=813 /DNA_ID=CAMNT_0009137109 /DNA_START=38 /DNA_END=2480 /DNA_ORIENTATION=-